MGYEFAVAEVEIAAAGLEIVAIEFEDAAAELEDATVELEVVDTELKIAAAGVEEGPLFVEEGGESTTASEGILVFFCAFLCWRLSNTCQPAFVVLLSATRIAWIGRVGVVEVLSQTCRAAGVDARVGFAVREAPVGGRLGAEAFGGAILGTGKTAGGGTTTEVGEVSEWGLGRAAVCTTAGRATTIAETGGEKIVKGAAVVATILAKTGAGATVGASLLPSAGSVTSSCRN